MVYGMATDDAHTFKEPGNPLVSGPGRGWVMVRAPRLEAGALMSALERGDFYASTGVVLDDVDATAKDLDGQGARPRACRSTASSSSAAAAGCCARSASHRPRYTFTGDEGYVRAKVIESNGRDGVGAAGVRLARVNDGASLERGEHDGVLGPRKVSSGAGHFCFSTSRRGDATAPSLELSGARFFSLRPSVFAVRPEIPFLCLAAETQRRKVLKRFSGRCNADATTSVVSAFRRTSTVRLKPDTT